MNDTDYTPEKIDAGYRAQQMDRAKADSLAEIQTIYNRNMALVEDALSPAKVLEARGTKAVADSILNGKLVDLLLAGGVPYENIQKPSVIRIATTDGYVLSTAAPFPTQGVFKHWLLFADTLAETEEILKKSAEEITAMLYAANGVELPKSPAQI